MERKEEVITQKWIEYEVGDQVKLMLPVDILDENKIYTVIQYQAPWPGFPHTGSLMIERDVWWCADLFEPYPNETQDPELVERATYARRMLETDD